MSVNFGRLGQSITILYYLEARILTSNRAANNFFFHVAVGIRSIFNHVPPTFVRDPHCLVVNVQIQVPIDTSNWFN